GDAGVPARYAEAERPGAPPLVALLDLDHVPPVLGRLFAGAVDVRGDDVAVVRRAEERFDLFGRRELDEEVHVFDLGPPDPDRGHEADTNADLRCGTAPLR